MMRIRRIVGFVWVASDFEEPGTWMSQEVCKSLGSVGCNPNISHV